MTATFSSLRRSLLLSFTILLSLTLLLASPTTAGKVTSATLASRNSTSLSLSIGLDDVADGELLKVLIQPEDSNATQSTFNIQQPMSIDVTNLKPDTTYTFTFSTLAGNTTNAPSATYGPTPFRTNRIGPQIIGFFASATENDGNDGFSAGDEITLIFDSTTNTPDGLDNAAGVDSLLRFSYPIGNAYSGRWEGDHQLVIHIDDKGQSAPELGALTCQVIGDIHSPDGNSDISTSISPPLIGSWKYPDSFAYFQPTKDGQVISDPGFEAYLVSTQINTNVTLPVALQFPSDASTQPYRLIVSVEYPNDANSIGFALSGKDFSYGPSTSIGTDKPQTPEFLSSMVPTVSLQPRQDYTGYVSVQYQLLTASYKVVTSLYLNVRIDPPARLYFPSVSSSGGESNNPIDLAKKNKTPLIIGLCVVFGFFFLLGISIFAWKKYRGGRDARDFESNSLTTPEEDPESSVQAGDAPTRRFYYDAKV